jgi:hypothetical protein
VVRLFRPASWLARWLGRLVAEDRIVFRIALVFAATQLIALGWDLPGSHGWENDGIAPRDLFGGLANNLTPGQAHRYPLLHYLLLGLLCLPVLAVAALAGPFDANALQGRVLAVPTMTAVSVVAKLLATAMSVVAVVVLARIVRRTTGARAGRFAALFTATNLTFAFYGRVSNLDVPYLFWTVLALDRLLDAFETGKTRDHLAFGALVAASVATKDQAYASYALVLPLYLVVTVRAARGNLGRPGIPGGGRGRFVLFAKVGLATLVVYGIASGALLNPTGFVRRVAELRGPSSQDWRLYSADTSGFLANVRAVFTRQPADFWPLPVLALAYAGVVVALFRRSPGEPLAKFRHLPFVAGISNLIFFALVVGRAEHRFLLPFGFFLSAYGGIASDALLLRLSSPGVRKVGVVALGAGLGWAGLASFAVHLTQLGDSRREVTRFLAKLPRGSRVETYGLTVYQPHFDVSPESPYRVARFGPDPPGARNPLVGVEETKGAIGDACVRLPDVIVLSEGFANAYLDDGPGSAVVRARRGDRVTTGFVRRAVADELRGYRQALVARAILPGWATALGLRPVRIQSTTGSTVWVLARKGLMAAEPAPSTLPTTTTLR